jgi:PKD repeat protein
MQFSDLSQLDQTHGPRSIVSWQWDFDDGTAQTLPGSGPIPPNTIGNSGTYEEPGHVFAKTGTFRVKLKLVTSNGCSAEFQDSNVPVGPVPKTDFNPTLICDQDNTLFASSHGISPAPLPGDLTYAWEFDDAATGVNNTSTVANPTHKFTGVDSYQVKLTITTNLGCDSTITKTTSILPFIQDGEFPYIESFESSNHGWVAEGHLDGALSQLTSWSKQPAPAGGIPKDPNEGAGDAFWATHTNVSPGVFYYNNERSILYGPCVDMTKLDRPVIAMDYFADLEHGFDGVYVEYLDEGSVGSDWTRLGDISTGLNWYTDGSIDGLSADGGIGQNVSQYGWTRATPAWTTARYNLNDLSGMDRVRFRLVFGSNKTLVNSDIYDGFAMDNFKLESRNRLVLVENFTSNSTSSTVSDNEDAYIDFPDDAPADEVVKIEYHTGIPAATGDPKDPIFEQNPMDPSGRASFYGLSSMPRAYIDGFSDNSGSENNGMFHGAWANKHYSTESLKTSPIDITIGVDPVIENGVMNIAGTVVAREIDLKANTYSLYVAVVEQDGAGDNTFVLRKMLPSASGVKVPATARGGSFNFSQSWAIDAAYLGSNPELRAVAFIQSDIEDPSEHANKRSVRQVLQAAYSSTIDLQDIPLTTGLETPFLEQTAMYPNPADKIVKIELPGATKTGVEVNVIDQLGRSVARSAIRAGEKSTSINIGDLAGSVYIVQLNENGVYTTRKLVVTHRN